MDLAGQACRHQTTWKSVATTSYSVVTAYKGLGQASMVCMEATSCARVSSFYASKTPSERPTPSLLRGTRYSLPGYLLGPERKARERLHSNLQTLDCDI